MLALALFMSFVVGAVVAVVGVWNLLVAPMQRRFDAFEKRLDEKLVDRKDSAPSTKRDGNPPDDEDKRRTLLPTGPDDVPLFGFAGRAPSDTLPSPSPTA